MKFHLILIYFIALCAAASAQTSAKQANPIAKEINVAEFNRMIIERPGQIIDVRTKSEVAKGAIPNSDNMDIFEDNFEASLNKLDKSKPVYVYCAVGGRSSEAMELMHKKGFSEVYNLDGGYTAWKKAK